MKRRIATFLFLALTALFSCNSSNRVFEQYHKFDNATWNRFDILKFDVPAEKPGIYDVSLVVRHTANYAYDVLPVYITIISSGEERAKEYQFKLRDKNGKFLGKPNGDIFESTFPVHSELEITKTGSFTVKIENIIPKYDTPDIKEIGLIVNRQKLPEKTEKDKKDNQK